MPNALAELQDFTGTGTVLAGKYAIEQVVGAGGMGAVVSARHLQLNTQVAIKFLLPRAIHQEDLVARFQREARAASRIAGPHVVRVLDVDLRSDGVPYIVMEFLEGETLQSLLSSSGPLSLSESVDYVLEAGEALAQAHAAGIAHRDLKPSNLFLAQGTEHEHTVKVMDFGIAKIFEAEHADYLSGMTASGAFIGSPPYMSPEQLAEPASVDSRTDIWSLGVVLYECLTGSTPFASSGIGQICARILQDTPTPVSSLVLDLPPELDRIVARCLSKAKEQRYATIYELASELAPFGSERAVRSLRVLERAFGRQLRTRGAETNQRNLPPRVTSSQVLSDTETALSEPILVLPAARRGRPTLISAVLVALAASATYIVLRHRSADSSAVLVPFPASPRSALAPPPARPSPVGSTVALIASTVAPSPISSSTPIPSGSFVSNTSRRTVPPSRSASPHETTTPPVGRPMASVDEDSESVYMERK